MKGVALFVESKKTSLNPQEIEIRKLEGGDGWDTRIKQDGKIVLHLIKLFSFQYSKYIYFINGEQKKYKQLTKEEKFNLDQIDKLFDIREK